MGHSDVERPMLPGAERRNALRVVYETVALVADYDGQNFPPFSAFWEVQTRDLSVAGMAFVSPRPPRTEQLVLMLGNPQAEPILIQARVVRCDPLAANGGEACLVGCEFLQRMTG
jgi:hypothetical protein